MTDRSWPASDLSTLGLDQGSDRPPREEFYKMSLRVTAILNSRGYAGGVAPLDATNKLPAEHLPGVPFTAGLRTKLNGIETAAKGDQTGAEIRALLDRALGGTAWRSSGARITGHVWQSGIVAAGTWVVPAGVGTIFAICGGAGGGAAGNGYETYYEGSGEDLEGPFTRYLDGGRGGDGGIAAEYVRYAPGTRVAWSCGRGGAGGVGGRNRRNGSAGGETRFGVIRAGGGLGGSTGGGAGASGTGIAGAIRGDQRKKEFAILIGASGATDYGILSHASNLAVNDHGVGAAPNGANLGAGLTGQNGWIQIYYGP